ncbi:MAG: crotonase/enoyl-CoA hydratase family protein [Hyphomicrobiales bacterium]|nr:crotonase/enoyl-CoA hydratase family protein [Hyphomicrobiales bacterium]
MSFSERVSVAIADGVAEVRLDRPDKLNALDGAMFDGLIAAGGAVSRQTRVRAVVLHGAGRGFSAGLDMQMFAAMASGRREGLLADIVARTHGNANAAQEAVLVWRRVPVPVIAAIHGPCFGGAFQIALGADIRYVAPDARLAILEIKWGLVPDMGGIALMRELARGDVIRELGLTGRELSGAEAAAHGFATAVHADPLAAARATAREIAGRSPDAVRALKRLLNAACDADMTSILLAESKEQAKLIGSPNQIEAIRAGVEKRPPRFADPD